MPRNPSKTSIPASAVEAVQDCHPDGAKKSARYFVGDEEVGYREWSEEGWLEYESASKAGIRHGYAYRFHSNGRVMEKEPYRDGLEHGTGRQWAEDGRLLVTWKLVRGVCLDLWGATEMGTLAEEHYWP